MQPSESALAVCVHAGTKALPTLVKLASVMGAKGQAWNGLQQLPVEIELGESAYIHMGPPVRSIASDALWSPGARAWHTAFRGWLVGEA